ncbi:MAG: DMT family transporter [Luteolibacter sp.]
MKTLFALITLMGISLAQEPTDRVVILPIEKAPKEAPLFFSATAEVEARAGLSEITGEQRLSFHVHQGKPEILTLGLSGAGDVTSVTGDGLRDWSVRVTEDGSRFLDVRPTLSEGKLPTDLKVVVKTRLKIEKNSASLLLPTPGVATGFSLALKVTTDAGVDLRVVKAAGLAPVHSADSHQFIGTSAAAVGIEVFPSGSGSRGMELMDVSVVGKKSEDGTNVSFHLAGKARSEAEGSSLELLGGGAALSGTVSGDGWHVALREKDGAYFYDLIAERSGEFPVALDIEVPVKHKGDWQTLDFKLPAGVVVPLWIEGLSDQVSFSRDLAVVPERDGKNWRGFLPVNGQAAMAWRSTDAVADGALFFSSTETSDVRVGSGLLRQMTVVDLRVLQGKLSELSLSLNGPGEVLSVSGDPVLGWSVRQDGDVRRLEVKLSRPIEGSGRIVIEAQSALGSFPVRAGALRMSPVGALRHSGWLRVANEGAVRIEVADARGLIQLAPGQFPGGVDEKLRQVFVYRFPSADYDYAIQADQVLPEIGVTEVTVYELGETDRRITSDLELDIREAPLREWEIQVPADYAVASVTGAEVADYAVASEAKDGHRMLKIIFKQAVGNRQLVSVKLEKNDAAKAGAWELSPLGFPGVKSRRGYVGAVAAAGYRLVAGKTNGVAEVPITFFPKKTAGLQQSFRLREGDWKVGLTVEALGQSVQADVFHLYSLKAGAAYGSILINYFVVGAPANGWRISVPEGVGNIDVTGQNVGRDWRREGNIVIIPLSRPVLGTGTVLLTFEQPMSARGGQLTPGEVRPLDVQAERGYVQVVSPLQVKFEKPVSEGPLLAIDPTELPAEFRLLSSAPTLAAWQYTARDFKIGMKIEWFEQGETVDQVVDFLKLSSQVSRDGQWVTDARFFVKSKGRNAMRMILPKGVSLWEAKVDGESVNARSDGGETLIPLPLKTDPNQAVEVSLRYGARSEKATRPRLVAPKLAAPVVIGEWTVTGDDGRTLVPRGGSAQLVRPALAENGWEWLGRHLSGLAALIVSGVAALILGKGEPAGARRVFSILAVIGYIAISMVLGLSAATSARGNAGMLEYAAPVVAAGSEVAVEIGNVAPWAAWIGIGMGLVGVLGAGALAYGMLVQLRQLMVAGLAMILAAVLSVSGGAALSLGGIASVGLWWLLPRVWQVIRDARGSKAIESAAVVTILALLCSGHIQAGEIPGVKSAESMIQDCRISGGRLHGTMEIILHGAAGDRFLLLQPPATLSGFTGAGLRVVKSPLGNADAYFLVAENSGRLTGKATFEMPLADPVKGWSLPGGPAAMRQVTVRWDQSGWEFFSPTAAKTQVLPGLAGNESGAVMVLGPANLVTIQARPKQRNISAEETRFFSEVSNLFLPGPGVVNGRHRVAIRTAQGKVSSLVMSVPEGFTVSDVVDGPVGSWRFDPEKHELRVSMEPAQAQAFALTIETQRGEGALPMNLDLEPIRVNGAAGEVGFLALAFGDDAQPEAVTVEGLSRVNTEDFTGKLVPRDKEGNPLVLLQNAFRYGSGAVKAHVKVAAVSPEIRAESWQLVSLGEDRMVIADDLTVTITRSGVFRLDVEIPDGLEIESATGEGLSHWTEGKIGNTRILTLHLSGKTIGKREFNLTLTGRPPGAQAKWTVPRLSLRDASRETGVVTVVPDLGLQVLTVDRKNVSQLDPRELADAPKDSARAAARPGALAYRLLQSDWSLNLAISRLDAWVTAQVYHDATLREGQMLTRAVIGYKIENASLKSLRVRIPGLDATSAATVRASGAAVADFVPVAGEDGLWEIRFQRGVAGETSVDIEFQRASKDDGTEVIQPLVLENVKKLSYFVAVRAGGRLELESGTLPRGWQKADWAVLQSTLGQAAGNVAPLMAFRVADPEGPLPVLLKRHQLADLQKLRVEEGSLTTLMSPDGDALTAVDLKMQVTGKGTLRLKLPKKSELFNVLVNDEGATLVREGDEWLFYVFPSPEVGRPATVRFVYSAGTTKGKHLEGPVLNVPMEDLTWRVLVPEGWKMTDHSGDFDLKQQQAMGSFRLEEYQSFVQSRKQSASKSAVALLDQANVWLRAGDQEKAGIALGNAVRSNQLDAASGEDARVQLRQLKTQQAVLGLNTRRQKLSLDNNFSNATSANEQLERAAEANPVLRGGYNYDPKQFDRFLEGNTADENSALKEIANRIVTQQLAAEPAPVALDVTLPERGTVLTFGRSVQVDGDRPMSIDLKLKRAGSSYVWLGMLLCLLVGAMGAMRKTSHS